MIILFKNDNGIENDTSSNLLPILSHKSVALTQVLNQVILNQYRSDVNGYDMCIIKSDVKG